MKIDKEIKVRFTVGEVISFKGIPFTIAAINSVGKMIIDPYQEKKDIAGMIADLQDDAKQ
jgi:hypothetical protein